MKIYIGGEMNDRRDENGCHGRSKVNRLTAIKFPIIRFRLRMPYLKKIRRL